MAVTALGWLAVACCTVAFYGWTVGTAERPNDPVGVNNRLGDAFAHGDLALRLKPPAGLLAVRDPFDSRQSGAYLHPPYADLALYSDRFYAYWGPVPAVLVFLPAHALGARLPESTVTMVFCLLESLFALLLLRTVLRRWVPQAPRWMQLLAAVVLVTSAGQLWLLRKPEVYTVAIAAGAAFLMAGLYALARGALAPRPRAGLLALGSLALGLAVGSRWSLAVALVVPVVVLGLLLRARTGIGPTRLAVALLGPMGICVALLAAYNWARFGSPVETGLSYTLLSFDLRNRSVFGSPSLSAVPYYFLQPFLVSPRFPYLWLDPRDAAPAVYTYSEPRAGLLWTAPIVVAAVPLALLALRRRPRALLLAIGAATLLAAAIFSQNLLYSFAAMRYHGDFDGLFLLAALASWFGARAAARRRRARRRLDVGFAAVATVGIVVTIALSANGLAISRPATLDSLDRAFADVPTAASAVVGHSLLSGVDRKPYLPQQRVTDSTHSWTVSRVRSPVIRVISSDRRSVALGLRLTHVRGLADTALSVRARSGTRVLPPVPVTGRSERLALPLTRGINDVRLELVVNDKTVYPTARYAIADRVRLLDPR